jgi:hypothetical protein
MSLTKTDTHYYDGKWLETYQEIIKDKVANCTFEQAIQQINSKWPQAISVSNILLQQRQQNYDHKNKVSIESLIPIIWSGIQGNVDLQNLFLEQYLDILGGTCSQGRTTRMFQILQLL